MKTEQEINSALIQVLEDAIERGRAHGATVLTMLISQDQTSVALLCSQPAITAALHLLISDCVEDYGGVQTEVVPVTVQ